jgi:hypothetical protein
MRIGNKYSSWYGKYAADKKEKFPYRIVRIQYDQSTPISGLEDVTLDAYSPSQARMLFLRKYTRLEDYIEMGYQIEAQLDEEQLRQRRQIAETERQRKEEVIQDAWWNND